jgi:hypothetical protein
LSVSSWSCCVMMPRRELSTVNRHEKIHDAATENSRRNDLRRRAGARSIAFVGVCVLCVCVCVFCVCFVCVCVCVCVCVLVCVCVVCVCVCVCLCVCRCVCVFVCGSYHDSACAWVCLGGSGIAVCVPICRVFGIRTVSKRTPPPRCVTACACCRDGICVA